ncbi:hypothetical protein OUZ56_020201 [Daphnia magna]|uniref:Uncharacterized protein n=1 Tax=Daphnia magna TaxID=35525 RepID=A0ABQ9ZDU5_9CRUS|nr:hypothetical protein OUZ56_020201 [Daphnia magna]
MYHCVDGYDEIMECFIMTPTFDFTSNEEIRRTKMRNLDCIPCRRKIIEIVRLPHINLNYLHAHYREMLIDDQFYLLETHLCYISVLTPNPVSIIKRKMN